MMGFVMEFLVWMVRGVRDVGVLFWNYCTRKGG